MSNDNWQNRIIGEGIENPEDLLANPLNWRIHPAHQQGALKSVLDRVGWIQRVIVNRRTGHVVDGHLRVALAMRQQQKEVPVLYVDLDEDEEKVALATLDSITGLAVTDNEKMVELIDELYEQHGDFMSELEQDEDMSSLFDDLRLEAMSKLAKAENKAAQRQTGKEQQEAEKEKSEEEMQEETKSEDSETQTRRSEYATFDCLIERDKVEIVYDAIRIAKERFGVDTTGEAIFEICQEFTHESAE